MIFITWSLSFFFFFLTKLRFYVKYAELKWLPPPLQMLKDQYLGYRKTFLGDAMDVFEARRTEAKKWQSAPRVTTGPTPFSNIPNAAAVAMAATLTQQQQPATGLSAFKL